MANCLLITAFAESVASKCQHALVMHRVKGKPQYPWGGHPRSWDPLGPARPTKPQRGDMYIEHQQTNSLKPQRGDMCIVNLVISDGCQA